MKDHDPDKRPTIQQCLDYLFKLSPELAIQAGILDPHPRSVTGSNIAVEHKSTSQAQQVQPNIKEISWKDTHPTGKQKLKISDHRTHSKNEQPIPLSERAAKSSSNALADVSEKMSVTARAVINKQAEEKAKKSELKITVALSRHRGNPPVGTR